MAIVYIDVDDEITSVTARIRRIPDGRIALVVPPGSRIATSRINFRLLAREAAGESRELAIVTPDAAVRALAAAAGLETYPSVADLDAAEKARAAHEPATGAAAAAGLAAGAAAAAGSGVRTGAPLRGSPDAAGGPAPADGSPTQGGAAAPGGAPAAGPAGATRADARPRPTTGLPVAAPAAAPASDRRGGTGRGDRSGRGRRRRWPWVVAALVVIAVVLGASGVVAYTTLPIGDRDDPPERGDARAGRPGGPRGPGGDRR